MFCKNIDVLWIFSINELFFLLKKFCFSSFNNSLLIPFFGIPPPFYRLFCIPYVTTGFREILSPKGGGETILTVYIWDLYSRLEHITEYLQFFMFRCNNCFRSIKMLYLLSQNITILIIYNSVINLSVQRYGKFTFTYQHTAKTVHRRRK